MTDGKQTAPSTANFKDTAKMSADAGIADESAAYEQAIEGDDDKVAEGQ
ncbi:hypothetical protein HMP09_1248 [Sphingomonas sp. HMP9]|nr:hypothetical protein [Sphingomonas sp. HMP9]BCA62014.1 hypothetical protein HMP09_1248 [Sphingomonas sp. HMP9]